MTAQNARLRRCGAALLCLVCAAVMVRGTFVGLEIDEEYALSLGFRLVSGDRLFYSMWEPHQLSSLPSAARPVCCCFSGLLCWCARPR